MMKRPLTACLMLLFSLTFISGCWDQKAIQNLRYLSALGLDYVDDNYVVYAQSVDLATVAMQEKGGKSTPTPSIISIGRGDTLQNAIDNMQKNSQIPQFSGFVSALIFHERLLKKEILPTFDILNRYGLLRYTKWVFGTRDSLTEVLSDHSAFGFSPLISVLHEPYDLYRERSFIEPIQYYQFTARFWEPGNTVLLPNITIYKHSWKENEKNLLRLTLDGVHAIHRGKWNQFHPSKDLLGLRWMNPHTVFSGLVIREKSTPKATLRIQHVKLDVKTTSDGSNPRFHITVHLRGFVREVLSDVSLSFIKQNAEHQVRKQIESTYAKALAKGADIYGLESYLQKYSNKTWKEFAKNRKRRLSEDAIAGITVKLYLSDSGKMKMKWYDYPEDLLP